jgi:hypothetical protein
MNKNQVIPLYMKWHFASHELYEHDNIALALSGISSAHNPRIIFDNSNGLACNIYQRSVLHYSTAAPTHANFSILHKSIGGYRAFNFSGICNLVIVHTFDYSQLINLQKEYGFYRV